MNSGTDRRGESLAWIGGLACLAAFVVLLIVSLYGDSASVFGSAWLTLGMVGIWIVTGVQLHQQRLLEIERLELAELERERQERLGGTKTIFDETDLEQMDALSMGRRLRTMERWFVPTAAFLVAAYHATFGFLLLPSKAAFSIVRDSAAAPIRHSLALFFTTMGVSFVAFLLSRSALSMARLREFRLVRAGGNAMFGVTLATLAAALAVGATNVLDWANFDYWVTIAIGIMMILLAIETILNFILDIYRPRIAGAEQRSFYDSRLLGMFSEPEGILKSIANAVDYQFGFKVSETWFYQLLGRWIVLLILIQASVAWLLTCVLVVPQGYQAVIEQLRWGRSSYDVARPGIHYTWPWPLDRVTLIPTDRIQRIEIGYARERESEADRLRRMTDPELWTTKHRTEEYALLVPDKNAALADDKSLPLNMLSVTIPIQWRVKSDQVLRYYRQTCEAQATPTSVGESPERILEDQAYRVLARFAASADVLDLLSSGGARAAERIQNDLQHELEHAASDGGDIGVEIVHLSLANVHPITTSAEAYETVVSSVQQKAAEIRRAEGAAQQAMIGMGGLHFQQVYDAILEEESLEKKLHGGDAEAEKQLPAARRKVESLLREKVGGRAREIVANAEQDAYSRALAEAGRATLFQSQVSAYTAAQNVYKVRQHLRTMAHILSSVRKFVIVSDRMDNVLLQVDQASPLPPDVAQAAIQGIKGKDQ